MSFAKKSESKKSESKKTAEKMPVFVGTNMYIQAARAISDNAIAFTLGCDGLAIYNMRIVDSSKGVFIAPPQEKYNNEYHSIVALYLDDATTEAVKQAVLANYSAKGEKADFKTRHVVADYAESGDLPF